MGAVYGATGTKLNRDARRGLEVTLDDAAFVRGFQSGIGKESYRKRKDMAWDKTRERIVKA